MSALFIAKPLGFMFREGAVQYTSRKTGIIYLIEPDNSGYLVSSDGLLIYTETQDRAIALTFIEYYDNTYQGEGNVFYRPAE